MAPRKNTGSGKTAATAQASGGRKKSKSSSPPKTPPRPRVMCPGCSTELALHKMLSNSEAFVYSSMTDMKKLGIECKNESCALYIEGVGDADEKLPVDPVIEKYVNDAKVERAAIKTEKKEKREQEKTENKKRKRDEKEAEYAKYDPFSGAKEKEAEEAIERQKQQERETENIVKSWKKIQKAAEKLSKLEDTVIDSVEE
ncbi:hypothetical protein INS49_007737 [Diaporthe citri]|uniref:uncharacterized protein n=1 Tax=Diaporthe citri TaxID=83186 RepID=UPI001C824517|nr:uncharacterized protein INS49_007737 [Diaporthe citri]KAG6362645.1 hypothetical protein INS49_007737 [Diaporthe citri]